MNDPLVRDYSSIRGELKTGDLLLFSGKGNVSSMIKRMTDSRYSHVGMILTLPEYDFTCLWESTTLSTLTDLDTGCPREGVQLVPLSTRLAQYDGRAVLRQLSDILTDGQVRAILDLRQRLVGVPYETDLLELIRSAYDGPFGWNSEDLSSVFCSEMTAEALQAAGILDQDRPSNEYTPADFSEDQEALDWSPGTHYRYGPEIILAGR